MVGVTLLLSGLFIRGVHESVHYLLASTGQPDAAKYVLNRIAEVNEENILTDKLAFSKTT